MTTSVYLKPFLPSRWVQRACFLSVLVVIFAGMTAKIFAVQLPEREPLIHGPKPPARIQKVAYDAAVRFTKTATEDAARDFLTVSMEEKPVFLSAQRTVDYRHPDSPAWLMVYKVGELGPRAHTSISQITLISEESAKIILSSPKTREGEAVDGVDGGVDNAILVQVEPGRFLLGLSFGFTTRGGGWASIYSLDKHGKLESVFRLPLERESSRYSESTAYFVRLPGERNMALAVHAEEIDLPDGDNPVLTKKEVLYRWDSQTGKFTPVDYPAAKLNRLIQTAIREKAPAVLREGSLAFWGNAHALDEEAAADRDLNQAYRKVVRGLSPDAQKRLVDEQRIWLAARDKLRLSDRIAYIRERAKVLVRMSQQKPQP